MIFTPFLVQKQFIQKMRADGKYDKGIASLSAVEIRKLLDEALMGKDLTKYTADSDETYNAFFAQLLRRIEEVAHYINIRFRLILSCI